MNTPERTDTPRTKAIGERYTPMVEALERNGTVATAVATLTMLATELGDHAKTLERELAQANARVGKLEGALREIVEGVADPKTAVRRALIPLAPLKALLAATDGGGGE